MATCTAAIASVAFSGDDCTLLCSALNSFYLPISIPLLNHTCSQIAIAIEMEREGGGLQFGKELLHTHCSFNHRLDGVRI